MFSKTCEYAIRAMIYIARQSKDGRKTGVKAIAAEIDSPEHFIAKILQDLVKKGLLQSAKGPNGGFYLEGEFTKCSIADIVRATDGDRLFTGCGLGLKQCSETRPCPIHKEFKAVRQSLHSMLESAHLDTFIIEPGEQVTFLKR